MHHTTNCTYPGRVRSPVGAIQFIKLINLAFTQSSCCLKQMRPVNRCVNKAVQTLPGLESASLLLPFTRPLQRISTYKNLFTSLQREPEECLPCQIPQCCLLGLTVLVTQATKYHSEKSETAEQNFWIVIALV